MSQAVRFGHFMIVVIVFTLAMVLGIYYPNEINSYQSYTTVDLTIDCNSDYVESCIYRQLIYRASFALSVLFLLMAMISSFSMGADKGFWFLKLLTAGGLFVAFWWGSNGFFSGWAETTRVLSFFWLLVQGLLLLDLAHDIHEGIMARADEESKEDEAAFRWHLLYVLLCLCFLTLVGVGLAYLFLSYFDNCELGQFYILLTLLMGVITTILSVLDAFRQGLLVPCILFAYSVFLCWYALLSSPDSSCNPTSSSNNGLKDSSAAIVASLSLLILLYCVAHGSKILNIFSTESPDEGGGEVDLSPSRAIQQSLETGNTEGEGGEGGKAMDRSTDPSPTSASSSSSSSSVSGSDSSGTTHERVFFHVLMVLVSIYGAMLLTSWGSTNGTPESGSEYRSTESMWLKITSQWAFLALYLKVLHAAYQNNQEASY